MGPSPARRHFALVGKEHPRVEDADVAGEAGNHEVCLEGCDDPRRDRLAGVHQHFDPLSEAIRVELFVAPGPGVAPQVEVEDRGQLFGRRGGDELSTGFESAMPNELVQRLGRKLRHQAREVRCVEQTGEGTSVF